MEYDLITPVKEAKKSEFESILIFLKTEVEKSSELSKSINYLSGLLTSMPKSDEAVTPPTVETFDITGAIWSELHKLKDVNAQLLITFNHLKEIIGS